MIFSREKLIETLKEQVTFRKLTDHILSNAILGSSGEYRKSLAPDLRKRIGEKSLQLPPPPRLIIEPMPKEEQMGPCGFDLRVGRFIVKSDTLKHRIHEGDLSGMEQIILGEGQEFILMPDKDGNIIYYIFSTEKVDLPREFELNVDAKSTTGRVGAMCQYVGRSTEGHIITAVQCYAFPLIIREGMTSLAQASIRYCGTQYMNQEEVKQSDQISISVNGKDCGHRLNGVGPMMSFSTEKAYVAKECDEPIDMDARKSLDWRNYFDLIESSDESGRLGMAKKTLHLLGTKERVHLGKVCGFLTREGGVHTGTGMWGHFAGIFQPGFSGRITMETYSPHRREVSQGDPAGYVVFDEIEGRLEDGTLYNGDYQNQDDVPKLPKMFKDD